MAARSSSSSSSSFFDFSSTVQCSIYSRSFQYMNDAVDKVQAPRRQQENIEKRAKSEVQYSHRLMYSSTPGSSAPPTN